MEERRGRSEAEYSLTRMKDGRWHRAALVRAALVLAQNPRSCSQKTAFTLSDYTVCETIIPSTVPMASTPKSNSLTTTQSHRTNRTPPFELGRQLVDNVDRDDFGELGSNVERERLLGSLRDDDLELMHKQLWYAGTIGNISPLHHQHVLRRDIILTERARLHLVWWERTIYVKRLEDKLLNLKYFTDVACKDETIHRAATGFLLSYMHLIQYPSNLEIAQKSGHVSRDIAWCSWQAFRSSVLHHLDGRNIHDRFEYGELRLGRLNQIYRLRRFGLTYFTVYREYSSYFGDNYKTLVALSVAIEARSITCP